MANTDWYASYSDGGQPVYINAATGETVSPLNDQGQNPFYTEVAAQVAGQITPSSPVTPETVSAVYQAIVGQAPAPDLVNQIVANYGNDSGTTINNVVRDISTVAAQNNTLAPNIATTPSAQVDPNSVASGMFSAPDSTQAGSKNAGNWVQQTAQNTVLGPSAWTQGYRPATGYAYVLNDYNGTPTIWVDANGNVSQWRGNNNNIWNTTTYNQAASEGLVGSGRTTTGTSGLDVAPLSPTDNKINWGMVAAVLGGPLSAALGPALIGSIAEMLDPGVVEAAATMGQSGQFSSQLSSLSTAILNAGKGALTAAVSGKDPLQGALSGGLSGGLGSYLNSELASSLQDVTGKTTADALSKILSSATAATASGLSGGKDLSSSLISGATSGLSSAATEGLGLAGSTLGSAFEPDTVEWSREDQPPANYVLDSEGNFQLDSEGNPITIEEWRQQNTSSLAKGLKAIGAPWISQNISSLFATKPDTSSDSTGGTGVSTSRTSKTGVQPTYLGAYSTPTARSKTSRSQTGSPTTTGQPNTQALAQALNVGSPSSGTSDTGSVDSPETGGTPQNVWNTASLRVKDATGSETE